MVPLTDDEYRLALLPAARDPTVIVLAWAFLEKWYEGELNNKQISSADEVRPLLSDAVREAGVDDERVHAMIAVNYGWLGARIILEIAGEVPTTEDDEVRKYVTHRRLQRR